MADGLGNYHTVQDATVIIGFHKERTQLIVDNLIAGHDGDDRIILLAHNNAEVTTDNVRLVKAERLDALASLKRAAVDNAAKVIVYAQTDAESFNICLAVRELNEGVHIACYFEDRDTARRAAKLAGIEPVLSTSCESLVRAAQDPGASKVLMALSSAQHGATIYSASVSTETSVAIQLLESAIAKLNGTFLAISQPNDDSIVFRPFPDRLQNDGVFYYLADDRLSANRLLNALGAEDVRILV